MFRTDTKKNGRFYRFAVVGLLFFSAIAALITIWIMYDFLREEMIVRELLGELENEALQSARWLVTELEWQFRLTVLVVLNVVVMGIAIAFLWRAYQSSQESLRGFKALAGYILDSIDQAIITTDKNGAITSINSQGLEMLKLETDYVGCPLSSLGSAIPLETFYQQWIENRQNISQDYNPNQSISDNKRVWRTHGQALLDANEKQIGFLIQIADVTQRLLMEDQMRRMERFMELGSIAAGLHHEIKNPLTALSLHIQLLDEHLNDFSPNEEVGKMLNVIKTEIFRVGDVLERFRDFASIERLKLAPVNLSALIQHQLNLISPHADQQSIDIQLQGFDQSEYKILADGGRLEQVLLNLLLNGLQAMPTGGTLTVSKSVDDDSCIIEISDTGNGIPREVQDKIFEPYFTTKTNGTGLGLALCEKIIGQHNGRLGFQSSPAGTTFRLILPKLSFDHGLIIK